MNEDCLEILLVEDNANDEALALYALRGLLVANKVQVARDGAEALDYAFCIGLYANRTAENPLLILLDKHLPLVDGLDVLRRLRADSRTYMIPVVMLTASSEERDIRDCYEQGANSYIVKPIDGDQFMKTAQKLGYHWLLIDRPPPDRIGADPPSLINAHPAE